MSDHLTEEEQLETLKRLWKEYGMTIITTVVVAVGGYFGWNYWQDQQRIKAETASALFGQLHSAVTDTSAEVSADDEGRAATIDHLVEQIKAVDTGSIYAWSAGLYRASEAVKREDMETAQNELEWVLSVSRDEGISHIARLRLARVMAARQQYEAALNTLEAVTAEAFASERAEIRGDILRLQGDNTAAATAYEEAMTSIENDQQRSFLIQMKLDDMASTVTTESGS